jgi:hypothetical protein
MRAAIHYSSCWCGTFSTDVRRAIWSTRLPIPIARPTPMYGPIPIRSIFRTSRCQRMGRLYGQLCSGRNSSNTTSNGRCLSATPSTPVPGLAPSPLTCEGDMVYTFTYTDCAANTHVWTYTYTIAAPTIRFAGTLAQSVVSLFSDDAVLHYRHQCDGIIVVMRCLLLLQ